MKKSVLFIVAGVVLFAGCTQQSSAPSPKSEAQQLSVPTEPSSTTEEKTSITLTMEEVAKHNTSSDCWFVIDGSVYDLTSFKTHPGGRDNITDSCGKDASKAFHNREEDGETEDHSEKAVAMLESYRVGKVGDTVNK